VIIKENFQLRQFVEVGIGYSTVEEREEKNDWFIPVDAFFHL